MQKLISPQNKIVVTIQKKFYDEIKFESGVTLYQDTSYHPEEFSMLEAVVQSIPRSIINRVDYEGYTQLPQVGDTILMRYDVVFAYHSQPDRDTPIYKNIVLREGEELWMADILQVFAIKAAIGYTMLNGYVMCDPLEEEKSVSDFIVVPESLRLEVRQDKMQVRYAGDGEVAAGDVIYCMPNIAQLYTINGHKFYIIKQSHIIAIDDCRISCGV